MRMLMAADICFARLPMLSVTVLRLCRGSATCGLDSDMTVPLGSLFGLGTTFDHIPDLEFDLQVCKTKLFDYGISVDDFCFGALVTASDGVPTDSIADSRVEALI